MADVTRTCASCGAASPADGKFCEQCGAAMSAVAAEPAPSVCGQCGAALAPDAAFCEACGATAGTAAARLGSATAGADGGRRRVVFIAGGIAAVVALAAASVFALGRGDGDEEPASAGETPAATAPAKSPATTSTAQATAAARPSASPSAAASAAATGSPSATADASATNLPGTSPTASAGSATAAPSTAAATQPAATALPPTATQRPPTATPAPPTATPVPPAATPQAGPPAAPSNLVMSRIASKDFLGFYYYEMSWKDNSTNELGFRIYNFDLFLTVAANTSGAVFDSFDLPSFTPDPCFSVAAYNALGESPAAVFCFPD